MSRCPCPEALSDLLVAPPTEARAMLTRVIGAERLQSVEESRVCCLLSLCTLSLFIEVHRFRNEWAMRHFLHPKLLRTAREVRVQLEDIMKFQKMELISAGTDFDVLRYGAVWSNSIVMLTNPCCAGKRSLQGISTRQQESKVSESLSASDLASPHISIQQAPCMDLDVGVKVHNYDIC